MVTTPDTESLRAHLRAFDRNAHQKKVAAARSDRSHILQLFPREKWPGMTLADYAIGDDRHPDNYCVWVEHRSTSLGSIRGGTARKFGVYRHRTDGWSFDAKRYADENAAWADLHSGFLDLFRCCDQGDWEAIDEIESLQQAPAVAAKTAYLYFPDELLPCYSRGHLRRFLTALGNKPSVADGRKAITLNRRLLSELRALPEAEPLSNIELMLAIYEWNDPRRDDMRTPEALGDAQMELLLTRFRKLMPDFKTFAEPGESFVKNETTYKHRMLERYAAELGNERTREMAASGHALEVIDAFSKIQGNLVSYQSWRPSFGEEEEVVGEVLLAFLEVAERAYIGASSLKPILRVLDKHGLKPAWDTLSFTLWVMRPEDYFPIKISYYRRLADELGTPLPKGRPGPNNFAQVMNFGRALEQGLEHLGPSDWIDVQSFLWVVCPGTYEKSEAAAVSSDAIADSKPEYGETEEEAVNEDTAFPLNQIFYGPPGTGKTYTTSAAAVEIIDGHAPDDRSELKARYDQLVEQARIGFVTFHQSYSYEDFVEGIRPVMDGEDGSAGPRYECRDGIFKSMCRAAGDRGRAAAGATAGARIGDAPIDPESVQVWKMSLGNTLKADDDAKYDDCIENGYVAIGYGLRADLADCDTAAKIRERLVEAVGEEPEPFRVQVGDHFVNKMRIGDLVVVSDGNTKFRAIGRVTGNALYRPDAAYVQTRSVEWLRVFEESQPRERLLKNKRFSQMSLYLLKSTELNFSSLSEMLTDTGVSEPRPYVLIIDEINRANISKVFGELITLLEPDKRAGQRNSLSVTLPYSQDRFEVPSNLYLIGTMNTADKSIALVDVALRRRFVFEELLPDFSCCSSMPEEVLDVLEELNRRITIRKDRDHQIGHSYFMEVTDAAGFDAVFRDSIVPLLQEYFYNDWEGLRYVLGERDGTGTIVVRLEGSDVSYARNRWCWYREAGHEAVDFLRVLAANYRLGDSADDGLG